MPLDDVARAVLDEMLATGKVRDAYRLADALGHREAVRYMRDVQKDEMARRLLSNNVPRAEVNRRLAAVFDVDIRSTQRWTEGLVRQDPLAMSHRRRMLGPLNAPKGAGMVTEQQLLAELIAEARQLRERDDALRVERDAQAAEVAKVQPQYEAACNATDFARAEELLPRLNHSNSRLRVIADERRDIEGRLRELDRLVIADQDADTAPAAVRAAIKVVEGVAKKIEANDRAIAGMRELHAAELAAAEKARADMAALAVASLPADVRELLGAQTPDPAIQPGDAAQHDQRARALIEAIDRANIVGRRLQEELVAARAARDEATQRLLEARAARAELAHAAALAAYLPALATFRAAHDLAYGLKPPMPDYRRHADESHGPAMEAARRLATEGLEDGVLKRGIKRVAEAVGLA